MIAFAVVDDIERLLRDGHLSQRKIAERLGVSRGTVNAIARGKRPDYRARKRGPEEDFVGPRGPLTRCPGCGAMVEMPCLACRVRAIQQSRRRPPSESPFERRREVTR
jgi:hypothetical protein